MQVRVPLSASQYFCAYAPSVLGRIKWARSLKHRIDDLLTEALQHPILKTLPATAELSKKYNIAIAALTAYEEDILNTWMNHNVSRYICCQLVRDTNYLLLKYERK